MTSPLLDHAAANPGLVGIIAQDTARFSLFAASVTGLEAPAGTQVKWVIGHPIASATNDLCRSFMANDELKWLLILGDDHAFAPDMLSRLLAHNVDVVVPLGLMRQPPYKPAVFSDWAGTGMYRRRVNLNDHPDGGLVPIHSAGSAGMLIRRHVLENLVDPWFESGGVSGVEIGEDVYFCDKAREMGFGIYVDLDTPMGHITTSTVWPIQQNDGWTYGFGFTGGLKVSMPTDAWEAADLAARL